MALKFNHKPGLVVYVTTGDPDVETTRKIAISAIDAGADVIELGVPFSDPLGDGPVIQRASERAVARHTRIADVLRVAREIRTARAQAGLVIDLIVEEAVEYLAEMDRVGLAPIFLAAPTSPDERIEAIATHSKGFIYAISRVGITGKQQSLTADAEVLVGRIRRWSKLPVAVGFGISNAEHVARVAEFADVAVVGSAIVELIERSTPEAAPEAVARFIKGLRQPQAALTH
jgi:tryptophan synthase alpha chain